MSPSPLRDAVAAAVAAPTALLALGIPACPSCDLLSVTLGEIAAARPDLWVGLVSMDTEQDWADRETVLWPRGIRVSRASVPALVVLRDGAVVANRHGGGPASVLDAWLAEHLGPAAHPVRDAITGVEHDALAGLGERRARLLAAKSGRSGLG